MLCTCLVLINKNIHEHQTSREQVTSASDRASTLLCTCLASINKNIHKHQTSREQVTSASDRASAIRGATPPSRPMATLSKQNLFYLALT